MLLTAQDYGEKVAKVRQAQKSFADDKERSFEAKVGLNRATADTGSKL